MAVNYTDSNNSYTNTKITPSNSILGKQYNRYMSHISIYTGICTRLLLPGKQSGDNPRFLSEFGVAAITKMTIGQNAMTKVWA